MLEHNSVDYKSPVRKRETSRPHLVYCGIRRGSTRHRSIWLGNIGGAPTTATGNLGAPRLLGLRSGLSLKADFAVVAVAADEAHVGGAVRGTHDAASEQHVAERSAVPHGRGDVVRRQRLATGRRSRGAWAARREPAAGEQRLARMWRGRWTGSEVGNS